MLRREIDMYYTTNSNTKLVPPPLSLSLLDFQNTIRKAHCTFRKKNGNLLFGLQFLSEKGFFDDPSPTLGGALLIPGLGRGRVIFALIVYLFYLIFRCYVHSF